MWLVAVVGRCVVGCEHCEGYCLIPNSNLHGARTAMELEAGMAKKTEGSRLTLSAL